MFNFKSIVQSAMLAAALLLGASPAIAGPVYHVNINTTALAAEGAGLMDFSFMSVDTAEATTVSLSNFSGLFGTEVERFGDVTDTVAGVDLSNSIDGMAWLTRAVNLGGSFSFDIAFTDDFGGADGVTFGVSLYNEAFSSYLGLQGPLVQFELFPAAGGQPSFLVMSENNAFATITAIPEPSDLLLMLTALAMLGLATRRGRKQG